MAPKIVDKDEKRQAIALTAVEVFGENGFERTRIDDVAKAAGVGKGTIYEYFKNKEELMDGALQVMLSGMHDALMPEPEPERSPVEILKEMSLKIVDAMDGMGGAYRFFLEYMLHASRKGDYGEFEHLLVGYRQWLATLIDAGKAAGEFREDVDSYKTAAAFAAWFDGAIFHWIVMPEDVSLTDMVEQYLEMTLRGLMKKGSVS
ncbi:MAG: TetR/AcrR family transcriptional regulator [Deltaproteobacteria bacterium]|nr:TetR/AcrR family transcriptional regulator [Deltaproteobacteria bacterium]